MCEYPNSLTTDNVPFRLAYIGVNRSLASILHQRFRRGKDCWRNLELFELVCCSAACISSAAGLTFRVGTGDVR